MYILLILFTDCKQIDIARQPRSFYSFCCNRWLSFFGVGIFDVKNLYDNNYSIYL